MDVSDNHHNKSQQKHLELHRYHQRLERNEKHCTFKNTFKSAFQENSVFKSRVTQYLYDKALISGSQKPRLVLPQLAGQNFISEV